MSVKNQKRSNEEVEYEMSIIVGIKIKTLQNLRKQNLIPRNYFRCISLGKVGIKEIYVYKREKTIQLIERLRNEGIIRKRKKIRQRKTRMGSSAD